MPTEFHLTEMSVTEEENQHLARIPDEEEIREVIFSMNPWKAPGPDGFPAIFYQKCWGIIGQDVVRFVKNFFINKHIPNKLNHTNLVLIPKKMHNEYPSDYRPIALCNVLYKVLAKILTNRIKPILHGLISPNQSAFVAGRQISENVITAKKTLSLNAKNEGKRMSTINQDRHVQGLRQSRMDIPPINPTQVWIQSASSRPDHGGNYYLNLLNPNQ